MAQTEVTARMEQAWRHMQLAGTPGIAPRLREVEVHRAIDELRALSAVLATENLLNNLKSKA